MATRPSTDSVGLDKRAGLDGSPPESCRVVWLGTMPYRDAWDLQVEIAGRVRRGVESETLLLLEHPHTYTRGRLSPDAHLLLDDAAIASLGAEVVATDRGGLTTYHGPGQLVAYPIIRLRGRGGPHWYVRTLERVIINSLSQLGFAGTTVPGLTGVWTADGQRKVAAIGVKIAGGVAYHGFAINVSTDLSMYDAIVPCGITDREVTSVVAELPDSANILTVKAVAEIVARQFSGVFGLRSETANAAAPEATKCNTTSL